MTCGKLLAPGQWWNFCGETDMGQTLPVKCTECGGEYHLASPEVQAEHDRKKAEWFAKSNEDKVFGTYIGNGTTQTIPNSYNALGGVLWIKKRVATSEHMNIYTSETEYLKTEVQRLSALVRAQQITIDKLEQALAAPVQEPVAWKWHQAPVKTSWGHDMVVADLAIDKDNTVSVYCERGQTAKVESMLTQPNVATPLAAITQEELQDLKRSEREGWRYADELEQERKRLTAQRQWVGLTDEQKCELVEMTDSDPQPHHLRELMDVTEAKLKEKNSD